MASADSVTIERTIHGVRIRAEINPARETEALALIAAVLPPRYQGEPLRVDNGAAVRILDPAGTGDVGPYLTCVCDRLRHALSYVRPDRPFPVRNTAYMEGDEVDAWELAADPRAAEIEIKAFRYYDSEDLTRVNLRDALLDLAMYGDQNSTYRPIWRLVGELWAYIPPEVHDASPGDGPVRRIESDFVDQVYHPPPMWEYEAQMGESALVYARRVLGGSR